MQHQRAAPGKYVHKAFVIQRRLCRCAVAPYKMAGRLTHGRPPSHTNFFRSQSMDFILIHEQLWFSHRYFPCLVLPYLLQPPPSFYRTVPSSSFHHRLLALELELIASILELIRIMTKFCKTSCKTSSQKSFMEAYDQLDDDIKKQSAIQSETLTDINPHFVEDIRADSSAGLQSLRKASLFPYNHFHFYQ